MTFIKYTQVKKALITASLAVLPVVGFSQDIKYNKTKDTVIVKSEKILKDISKYKVNSNSGTFVYKIPVAECDNLYNPKTQGIYDKEDARKWRKDYNNWKNESERTIANKNNKINALEKELKNAIRDTIVEKEGDVIIYNIDNRDNSTNIINNFYDKKSSKNNKKLVIRGGLEGGVNIDKTNPNALIFGQVKVSGNKESGLWMGPYVGFGFTSTKENFSEEVYNKTILEESIDMSLVSSGIRTSVEETAYPLRVGIRTSFDVNKKIRFNLDLGGETKTTQLTNINESGNDEIFVGNELVDSKPYMFEKNNERKNSDFIPNAELSFNFSPAKNNWYVGAFANTKKQVGIKAGLIFGRKNK